MYIAKSVTSRPAWKGPRERLLLRQIGRGEAVAGKHALAMRRKHEHGEAIGGRRRIAHYRQPIVRTDRKSVWQRHHPLVRMFSHGRARRRAIGEENVSAAFGNVPAVGAAAGRRCCARRSSGELQRLAYKLIASALRDRVGIL